ncbi:MAG: hypothetical protein ACI80P_000574 [Flavobacteriales bacterium]|jgi:hypothetical protein
MLHKMLTPFTKPIRRFACYSLVLLCAALLSYSFKNSYYDTASIEVNMRISLEKKRSGLAHITILSVSEEPVEIEATTKEDNLFFLKLGALYKVVISAPGFASKCLVFDAMHPKAREGEFPCDIDLFENNESYFNNPPIVGQITWNNFKKSWIHKKTN